MRALKKPPGRLRCLEAVEIHGYAMPLVVSKEVAGSI